MDRNKKPTVLVVKRGSMTDTTVAERLRATKMVKLRPLQ